MANLFTTFSQQLSTAKNVVVGPDIPATTFGGGSGLDLIPNSTVQITTRGFPVLVLIESGNTGGNIRSQLTSANTSSLAKWQLERDNVFINNYQWSIQGPTSSTIRNHIFRSGIWNFLDHNPPAGLRTYRLQHQRTNTTGYSVFWFNMRLKLIELDWVTT